MDFKHLAQYLSDDFQLLEIFDNLENTKSCDVLQVDFH